MIDQCRSYEYFYGIICDINSEYFLSNIYEVLSTLYLFYIRKALIVKIVAKPDTNPPLINSLFNCFSSRVRFLKQSLRKQQPEMNIKERPSTSKTNISSQARIQLVNSTVGLSIFLIRAYLYPSWKYWHRNENKYALFYSQNSSILSFIDFLFSTQSIFDGSLILSTSLCPNQNLSYISNFVGSAITLFIHLNIILYFMSAFFQASLCIILVCMWLVTFLFLLFLVQILSMKQTGEIIFCSMTAILFLCRESYRSFQMKGKYAYKSFDSSSMDSAEAVMIDNSINSYTLVSAV